MKKHVHCSGGSLPRIACLLVLGLCFCIPPALAGDIVINGPVGAPVVGNGNPPNGAIPGGSTSNFPDSTTGNSVTVNSGGSVTGSVYGGFAYSGAAGATATNNSVLLNGGAVAGDVIGAQANSLTGAATASNNSVVISGGTVSGSVYGGWAAGSGAGNLVEASNNSVVISGGTVSGSVYGGFANAAGGATGAGMYNSVTLSGNPDLSGSNLYGTNIGGSGDRFTGNTLNVWNYSGSAVNSVQNFQFFDFRIPSTQIGPVLTVTGTATLGNGITGSTVDVIIEDSGRTSLRKGDQFILIDAGTLTGTLANTRTPTSTIQWMQGVSLIHVHALDFDLDVAGNQLLATVNTSRTTTNLNPQTKALSEGVLSGVALLNQGADLVAGKGMSNAVDSSRQISKAGASGGYGLGVFGALSGGWSRYNTGSHVDVSGLSLIAGLSFGADLPPGRLTLGAFFEYGTGAYDTYNSFATDYHGKGNIYHLGGGVLGRMDFVDTGPGNFYTEASFRAGGLHNDYRNSDLRDLNGRRADYDSFSPYYGIHAGLGYIWKFTEKASLDLYGKYFWTRQQGDSVTLKTGDPVKFKDADSHRLRLGGRLAYAVNDYVAPYIGAAWEYEMDGRQRASTYGYAIDTPTLHGSTGIGELGLTLKPSKELPLSFDLGVQGYVGKREGVTGSLQIRFEF